jgi:hypothetical protein
MATPFCVLVSKSTGFLAFRYFPIIKLLLSLFRFNQLIHEVKHSSVRLEDIPIIHKGTVDENLSSI